MKHSPYTSIHRTALCWPINGNLTNQDELAKELFKIDHRHLNTSSDSEVLLNILAHELQIRNKEKLEKEDIFAAVEGLHKRCRGAYAVIAAISGHGMIAFRDPHAIRPLVIGERKAENGKPEYMFASESVALDVLGFENIRDLEPGEAIYINGKGEIHCHVSTDKKNSIPLYL